MSASWSGNGANRMGSPAKRWRKSAETWGVASSLVDDDRVADLKKEEPRRQRLAYGKLVDR
jgi:hypothetical protein